MKEQLEAAIVGIVMALLCFLNLPIADTLKKEQFTPEYRAEYLERVDPITATIVLSAVDFNHWYDPVQEWFEPALRLFHTPQTWLIYNHVPYDYRICEVRIDDEVVFRTPGTTGYSWHYWPLRHFRLAYQLNDMTRVSSKTMRWRQFGGYIVDRAWEDFPDAERIDIIWYSGDYPGTGMFESHRVVSLAPRHYEYRPTPPVFAGPGPADFRPELQ